MARVEAAEAREAQLREALETIRDEAHDLILFAEGEGHTIAMTDHHKDCYAIVKRAEAVLRDSERPT